MKSIHWLLTATIISASTLPASTYFPPKNSEGLRDRFGTDSTAADFIFVVNTSSSLSDAGVFAELRTQMPQLLTVLSPRDNFILIGFNEKTTTIVSACPAGENTLPFQSKIFRMRDPRGRSGSLREGLGAALNALNRPGHAPLQFLFLLIDGKITAAPQSSSTPDSLSWEILSKLHTAWQESSIAEIYGLVVGDPSELQIIRMVFPEIRFVETSIISLRGFFERWRSELPARKLRLQLAHEIAGNVLTVQPIGRLKFTDRQTTAKLTVRVRSRLRKLTLTLPYVGEWSVFPDWLKVTPRYEDFPMTLAPGQSGDLVVTISREPSEHPWGCWHWQSRDKELAQISFVPAVSLVDHAAIRSLGVDPPVLFMNKLAVEIVRQHGQPAVVLWIAIGVVGLMLVSVAMSRTYDIAGTDFAVSFVKTQFARVQKKFGKHVPQSLMLSDDFKLSLMWIFATSFILSMTFVVATIAVLLLAEHWLGKVGVGITGFALFVFWGKIVWGQFRSYSNYNQTADVVPLSSPQKAAMPSLIKPTLDSIVDD